MFPSSAWKRGNACELGNPAGNNISVHFSVERIVSIDYLIPNKLIIIKLLVIL